MSNSMSQGLVSSVFSPNMFKGTSTIAFNRAIHTQLQSVNVLLSGQNHRSQVMIFQFVEQAQKRKKQIVDIISWVRAFSIYSAVLAAAEEIRKEDVVGLFAHTHLMTQLLRRRAIAVVRCGILGVGSSKGGA